MQHPSELYGVWQISYSFNNSSATNETSKLFLTLIVKRLYYALFKIKIATKQRNYDTEKISMQSNLQD